MNQRHNPRFIQTASGGFLELIEPDPDLYTDLARRAREASPEERLEAALAYARSRLRPPADPIEWSARMYESYLLREEPSDEP